MEILGLIKFVCKRAFAVLFMRFVVEFNNLGCVCQEAEDEFIEAEIRHQD